MASTTDRPARMAEESPSVPLPRYAQVEPVGQCNLRCQMCPVVYRDDGPASGAPAFMDFQVYDRVLTQLPDLDHLHLQGLGEPMMHPQFFEMVELAKARGLRVTINTNLTVLNERRAARCITSGLDTIHVSIDAASAATYARIRVGSRLERVVRNLEFLTQAKRAAQASSPDVKLVTVAMRQNLAELVELVRLAHRFEIRSIFVQHLCHDFGESTLPERYRPMRSFVEEQTLLYEDREVIESHFDSARREAAQLGIDLRLPRTVPIEHAADTPGPKRCDWPWRGAYITYQGYLLPCCMISTPDRMHLGHLDDGALANQWNGPVYGRFRDQLDSSHPPEICASCAIYRGVF